MLLLDVATVHLDVVHLPLGQRPGVLPQVPRQAGVARAGQVADVLVDAELQTQIVDLVGNVPSERRTFGSRSNFQDEGFNRRLKTSKYDETWTIKKSARLRWTHDQYCASDQ